MAPTQQTGDSSYLFVTRYNVLGKFPQKKERKISEKCFSPKSSADVGMECPCKNACFFPGFEVPDRSFWAKFSSLKYNFV